MNSPITTNEFGHNFVHCNLCRKDDTSLLYKIKISNQSLRYYRYANNIGSDPAMIGDFNIVKCNHCAFVYTNPRFNTTQLGKVYASNKIIGGNWQKFPFLFKNNLPDEMEASFDSHQTHSSKANQWKFDIIKKHFQQNTNLKLLDIGCGKGAFVYDALQNGFDANGIDLSPDRIEQGKKQFNLSDRLMNGNIDSYDFTEKYDIITLFDVIEHVEDPAGLLQNIRKILKPNGKIFALTMSLDSITYRLFKQDWNYINPTQHLSYFSHDTMKKMMDSNGFELLKAEMDNSKDKNIVHLGFRIFVGQANHLLFKCYQKRNFVSKFLHYTIHRNISLDRMSKRIENLYPGKYIGRYHDNFVFVAKPKKN